MLIVPTVTGIRTFIGRPSVPHFSISPATCQGQAADAVAALAHARNLRPLALEILCVPRFAHLQKILNTAPVSMLGRSQDAALLSPFLPSVFHHYSFLELTFNNQFSMDLYLICRRRYSLVNLTTWA